VILLDANLILYAYDSSSPYNAAARGWLEEIFSGTEQIRMDWTTVLAFLRIGTNPRLAQGFTLPEAISIVEGWFEYPHFSLIAAGDRHWRILAALLPEAQARGPLVMDAHLAALAIEHGATLYTNDRDFSRFPGLKCVNPFAAPKL
jgi:toxin-antitoxin system PIN domain toxin